MTVPRREKQSSHKYLIEKHIKKIFHHNIYDTYSFKLVSIKPHICSNFYQEEEGEQKKLSSSLCRVYKKKNCIESSICCNIIAPTGVADEVDFMFHLFTNNIFVSHSMMRMYIYVVLILFVVSHVVSSK